MLWSGHLLDQMTGWNHEPWCQTSSSVFRVTRGTGGYSCQAGLCCHPEALAEQEQEGPSCSAVLLGTFPGPSSPGPLQAGWDPQSSGVYCGRSSRRAQACSLLAPRQGHRTWHSRERWKLYPKSGQPPRYTLLHWPHCHQAHAHPHLLVKDSNHQHSCRPWCHSHISLAGACVIWLISQALMSPEERVSTQENDNSLRSPKMAQRAM